MCKEIIYDYSKLEGRIKEFFGTQGKAAKAMNISEKSLSAKINNGSGWKQGQIEKACEVLCIERQFIGLYFFTILVQ